MERKMATVRRIEDIQPIPGADLIEAVKIGGWTVVAQKSMQYKTNDFVIYCEIDSFIPTEIAPFLTQAGHLPKEYNGIKGERLRTKKMKGVISQGLLLPLDTLSKFPSEQWFNVESFENQDVSELLGIIKWEPKPEFQSADAKGLFPSFIPKTDQERVQNLMSDYQKWYDEKSAWEVTEKRDGSSMTVFFKDSEIGVCSRNLELKEDLNNTFWKTAYSSGAVEALKKLGRNIVIQGELVGPGIQGNKYNLSDYRYYVYDVFDIDKQEYFLVADRRQLVKQLDLLHVPVYYDAILQEEDIQEVLLSAEGKSDLCATTEREGKVYKNTQTHESFKAISNRWLMKFE